MDLGELVDNFAKILKDEGFGKITIIFENKNTELGASVYDGFLEDESVFIHILD
ncbi:MAG: hypothetical protein UT24_C0019G0033 [Candidatus Woesebacteria bacterium GW2011_GWB1_39_12]|uniref:Uncharacterized protein n=1 Tax=Candidatus Woesebacteria bacterium GW2011_GWB1_39_12 TaxID=1618574 RepID=A0A0G0M761_9BACT|nr:MAG: hypothetical protein UT24_C0019G0033 [Candidatus Woesebacteria bacterium GW2011_GWB1_39_12]